MSVSEPSEWSAGELDRGTPGRDRDDGDRRAVSGTGASALRLPEDRLAELTIRVQAAVVAVGEGLEREVQARMAVLTREMESNQAHVARLAETLASQLRELAAWRAARDEDQARVVDEVLGRLDRLAEDLVHLRRRVG